MARVEQARGFVIVAPDGAWLWDTIARTTSAAWGLFGVWDFGVDQAISKGYSCAALELRRIQ